MFTEKPSCITELKQIASSLTDIDFESNKCIVKIKEILKDEKTSAAQKILKLKEICKDYDK